MLVPGSRRHRTEANFMSIGGSEPGTSVVADNDDRGYRPFLDKDPFKLSNILGHAGSFKSQEITVEKNQVVGLPFLGLQNEGVFRGLAIREDVTKVPGFQENLLVKGAKLGVSLDQKDVFWHRKQKK